MHAGELVHESNDKSQKTEERYKLTKVIPAVLWIAFFFLLIDPPGTSDPCPEKINMGTRVYVHCQLHHQYRSLVTAYYYTGAARVGPLFHLFAPVKPDVDEVFQSLKPKIDCDRYEKLEFP